jgi:hypothetical protein
MFEYRIKNIECHYLELLKKENFQSTGHNPIVDFGELRIL